MKRKVHITWCGSRVNNRTAHALLDLNVLLFITHTIAHRETRVLLSPFECFMFIYLEQAIELMKNYGESVISLGADF
jgi:hypothetical protein